MRGSEHMRYQSTSVVQVNRYTNIIYVLDVIEIDIVYLSKRARGVLNSKHYIFQ